MTAGPAMIVVCDAADDVYPGRRCRRTFTSVGTNIDDARNEAARDGWATLGEDDVCPEHAYR